MIKRAGLSPVIASIILSSMVLLIGAGVWTYSNSAASVIASDYANDTVEMVNTIQERFTIEHASFDNSTYVLSLWIYNYGDVGVNINSRITINGTDYENNSISLDADEYKEVTFSVGTTLEVNEDVIIYVLSTRGNFKRETYYVQ